MWLHEEDPETGVTEDFNGDAEADLAIAKHEVGTLGFFDDLDAYRFEKLDYLPKVVDFSKYAGKEMLEVGCGVGIEAVRFAQAGVKVTGIDLAQTSIDLAKKNFQLRSLEGNFQVMNGEAMDFADNSFDLVYVHGVIQYTASAQKMIDELRRVVRPDGEVIMMVYNKVSWLNMMSSVMNVGLEHEDAPVLNKYSIKEFQRMLSVFSKVKIVPERFPVKSRLHKGFKGALYNGIFVPFFKIIPRPLIRRYGWHIMVFACK